MPETFSNYFVSFQLLDNLWGVVVFLTLFLCILPFSIIIFDIVQVNFDHFLRSFFPGNPEELTSFHYKHTKRNGKIQDRIMSRVGHYIPPRWYSPHLGTLIAFGHDPQLPYECEMLKSSHDMGEFLVSWYPRKPSFEESLTEVIQIVVFFPGLGLSARSKVSQQFVHSMAGRGFYSVVVGARGVDSPLSTKKFWHPGFHEDGLSVVEYLQSHYDRRHLRLFLVGYSAGSNLVHKIVRHLSQEQRLQESVVRAAMCVCVNSDYLRSRSRLESSWLGWVYSLLMCSLCKDILLRNAHVFEELDSLKDGDQAGQTVHSRASQLLAPCYLLSHYDAVAGRVFHGYQSEEHLNECLSMADFSSLGLPLLALQPRDDPLHLGRVRENICPEQVAASPQVLYVESKYGNHFGFYEGGLLEAFQSRSSYTYPARLAAEFFEVVLEEEEAEQASQR